MLFDFVDFIRHYIGAAKEYDRFFVAGVDGGFVVLHRFLDVFREQADCSQSSQRAQIFRRGV